jgi:hypothetical protein
METGIGRPKANGATQAFAVNSHGNGSDPPGNGHGEGRSCEPAQSSLLPRANANQAHAPSSRNGSHPFIEPATGSIIGAVRKPYDRLPHEPYEDERLGPAALGILSYVFSRPPTWDISVKQLLQRFGGHKRLVRQALKQLQQAGWMARAVLFGENGKACGGQMWFARTSLDVPWPKRFMTKGLDCRKVHFTDVRKPARLNNTDKGTTTDSDIRARARGKAKRKAAKQVRMRSSSLVRESYQYQPQSKPDKAHIANALASNWNRPAQDHPKWPEFHTWCRKKGGKPQEKGFWTWLAGQPAYWRDKIKPPDEIQGYDLDGKFYEAAAANKLLAADPDKYDVDRFRPAVKRHGKVEIIDQS